MRISRLIYYVQSVFTLLLGVRNRGILLSRFFGSKDRVDQVALTNGLRFNVRTFMDIWIIKETCLDACYDKAGVPIEDGWTMLDIGGALGDFSVHAARLNPHGVVYAFEPSPDSFALLEQNLALNGITNVRAFPVGVSSAERTLMLETSTEAVMHSAVIQAEAQNRVEVPAMSLAQILADYGIEHCDYLKMDVEGAEYDILMGSDAATLSRVHRLCMEYHNVSPALSRDALVPFLEQHGFRVRVHPSPVHHYIGLLYAERQLLR